MTIHFITVEVSLHHTSDLNQAIEAELQKQGDPLRWAITHLDTAQQKAYVEAIVTRE